MSAKFWILLDEHLSQTFLSIHPWFYFLQVIDIADNLNRNEVPREQKVFGPMRDGLIIQFSWDFSTFLRW